jgi:hypothetical protein
MHPISEFYRGYLVEAVPIGERWHARFYPMHDALPLQPVQGARYGQQFVTSALALTAAQGWVDESLGAEGYDRA